MEHYAAATQDCTDAVRLSGGYFLPVELCINVMGQLASPEFENREAAILDYDEALRLDPNFAAAYLFRGLAYRTLGDIEAAIQDFEQALRLDPPLFDLLIMYWSMAYVDPIDREAAIEEVEAAVSLVEPGSDLAAMLAIPLANLRGGE